MSFTEETRRESMQETYKTSVSVSGELYKLLFAKGPLTAWELAALANRAVYTVRPRLTEMCHAGKIKEVGTRFHSGTDRNETVYEVVNKQLDLI